MKRALPPTLEVAEKAPAEMVEPEWIGVMPAGEEAGCRLVDEVWTRRGAGSGPAPRSWGCRWPEEEEEGLGAPMPARAWAAWIREAEAGASGGEGLERERWWMPWRGMSGGGGGVGCGGGVYKNGEGGFLSFFLYLAIYYYLLLGQHQRGVANLRCTKTKDAFCAMTKDCCVYICVCSIAAN